MAKAKSQERENRIRMEIVVDANGPEEVAMGWYYYLDDVMKFPFTAACNAQRATSPLKKGDEVEVTALADTDDCEHEIFVMTRWDGKNQLAVPLAQLKPASSTDEATKQAIADWHYWVEQGYDY
ncbi:MAG: calcium-binding protein [Phycisphaerae bacterium]